jgi:hypothetical protein
MLSFRDFKRCFYLSGWNQSITTLIEERLDENRDRDAAPVVPQIEPEVEAA